VSNKTKGQRENSQNQNVLGNHII